MMLMSSFGVDIVFPLTVCSTFGNWYLSTIHCSFSGILSPVTFVTRNIVSEHSSMRSAVSEVLNKMLLSPCCCARLPVVPAMRAMAVMIRFLIVLCMFLFIGV